MSSAGRTPILFITGANHSTLSAHCCELSPAPHIRCYCCRVSAPCYAASTGHRCVIIYSCTYPSTLYRHQPRQQTLPAHRLFIRNKRQHHTVALTCKRLNNSHTTMHAINYNTPNTHPTSQNRSCTPAYTHPRMDVVNCIRSSGFVCNFYDFVCTAPRCQRHCHSFPAQDDRISHQLYADRHKMINCEFYHVFCFLVYMKLCLVD